MKTTHRVSIAVLSVIFLAACEPEQLTGNGVFSSESRDLEPFTKLTAAGSFKLRVTQGPRSPLKIVAEENILPLITSTVVDGELTIAFDLEGVERRSLPYLTLSVPRLDTFHGYSSVVAYVGELAGDTVKIDAHDTAHLYLAQVTARSLLASTNAEAVIEGGGMSVEALTLEGRGTSTLNFRAFPASEVNVVANDRACVTTTARSRVTGTANGASTVEISGLPARREIAAADGAVMQFWSANATGKSCAERVAPLCVGSDCQVDLSNLPM